MGPRGMVQDPYKYFRPEARELVDQFAKGVLELERDGGSTPAVQKLLRVAHTLKGAARVVKQSQIADSAHALEDMLSPYRDKAHDIARDQIDLILAHLDQISSRLDTLDARGTADPSEPRRRDGEENLRTFRADVAETDAVLEGVAEAHALLNKLRSTMRAVEQARRLTDLLTAQLGPVAAADGARQPNPGPSRRIALAQELGRTFAGIERGLGTAVDQMDRELRQLREAAERLRLIAAGTLFTALERTARDAARALGKNVDFARRGGDIRLDARVLETMQGALIQIVRNAVAHGIEPEAERIAAGKPSAGKVSVHVTRRGQRIAFQVSDDGRGVDLEAVRKVASERGLIDRGGRAADAEALVRLLLKGGISTSATVTGVAGRGVGLDVVREGVERLGGEVLLRTERGAGTTVELIIPPSLASMDVLIAEAEGPDGAACVSSMPLDAVRGTLLVRPGEISRGSPGDTIVYGGKAIPFIPLATALDGTSWSPRRGWTTVVLDGAGGEAAIGVDRLLGTGRMVVRPLPEHLHASPTVVGATLDSDGNPQL